MHHIRNFIGYFIAGFCAMLLWPMLADFLNIGLFGNWIAAVLIIGPLWFINHHIGLIKHHEESAFVDMAIGIGVAGLSKGYFIDGLSGLFESLPTLILVILGGSFGGFLAYIVEKRSKIA